MSLGEEAGDQQKLRALAHPVRLRIMSLLTGAELTAAEVARELGLTHANASYHLRNLLSGGMIVVAGEEKIRGGIAKRYRYELEIQRGTPAGGDLQADFVAIAEELIRRTAQADWDQPKNLVDGELWVDPEVWKDLRKRIADAAVDLHNAARPPRTPGTVRTSTTVAMFALQQPEPPGAQS